MNDRRSRATFHRVTRNIFMAMVVFYVVILALSYRGTLLAFLDGTLTDASGAAYPGWLLFFYFSGYHMFFPMVLWTILPVLEGSQIAAVGLCCGIACDFLAETKDLLLKHAREEEGAFGDVFRCVNL